MTIFVPINSKPPFLLADWESDAPTMPTVFYESSECPVCGKPGQTCIGEGNGLEVEEDPEELARREERNRLRDFFGAADRGEL